MRSRLCGPSVIPFNCLKYGCRPRLPGGGTPGVTLHGVPPDCSTRSKPPTASVGSRASSCCGIAHVASVRSGIGYATVNASSKSLSCRGGQKDAIAVWLDAQKPDLRLEAEPGDVNIAQRAAARSWISIQCNGARSALRKQENPLRVLSKGIEGHLSSSVQRSGVGIAECLAAWGWLSRASDSGKHTFEKFEHAADVVEA